MNASLILYIYIYKLRSILWSTHIHSVNHPRNYKFNNMPLIARMLMCVEYEYEIYMCMRITDTESLKREVGTIAEAAISGPGGSAIYSG